MDEDKGTLPKIVEVDGMGETTPNPTPYTQLWWLKSIVDAIGQGIQPIIEAINVRFSPRGDIVSTNVQYAIEEVRDKMKKAQAGSLTPDAFSGNPKRATVTLPVPYADNNYSVTITGKDGRSWVAENLTLTTFDINSQANQPLSDKVFWKTQTEGVL